MEFEKRLQAWPSGGSSDSWDHLNQHPPTNQNVVSSVPMDIDDGTIHNGYRNEDALLFDALEMGNSETSAQDLGNSSGFLEHLQWSRAEQRSEEEGKMMDGITNFSGYNNLAKSVSGYQENLSLNGPSPSTNSPSTLPCGNLAPLPPLPSGNLALLQVKEEEISADEAFQSLPSGNLLPSLPSGNPLSSLPSGNLAPLPSPPSGNLALLQVKEEQISADEAFSSVPNSEGQNEMALIVPMERGGVVGGGGNSAATLEGSAGFSGSRKRRNPRHRRPHYNITNCNLTMNMHANPVEIQPQATFNPSTSLQPPPQLDLHSQRPQRRGNHGHMNAGQEIRHEINKEDLEFLLQKALQNSDVGTLGRVVIPKRDAEAHLPALVAREGIMISMVDMDTLLSWNFKFRFWPNNKSRMYILENTGQFVRSHGLVRGDYMMVYRDNTSGQYVIKGKKASEDEEASRNSGGKNEVCSASLAINGGSSEQEAHQSNQNEVSSNSPYESSVGANGSPGHEYFSTVGDIFNVDLAIDFTGIPNCPQLESIPSFGSDDMDGLDDFFP